MADPAELIVEFVSGTSEDDARSVVSSCGATVRRRMRADPGQVTLLVRVAPEALAGAQRSFDGHRSVARTEHNHSGFGIR